MMPNNHKNQGCGYDQELVSYLYGETSAAECAVFEAHLETCSPCAAELAAFAGVKFSINDWKLKEFNALSSPAIEISYEKPRNAPEVFPANRAWLSKLGKLLSLSPAWSTATASGAVLAVFIGIAFFSLNSKTGSEVAKSDGNSKLAVTPTIEKSAEPANPAANQNPPAARETLSEEQQNFAPQPRRADEKRPAVKRTPKAASDPRPAPKKAENAVMPKIDQAKRNIKNNNEVAPKILDDEDEDDTLRLAELFEEIDTVE